MKTLTFLSAATLFLSACSTAQQTTGTYNDDDVYASSKDQPAPKATYNEPAPIQNNTQSDQSSSQTPSSTAVEQDAGGNTYITNKYYDSNFDADDYYDYEYAARMRRFYHPVYSYGYYDNYYTNSYWYSCQPAQWGLSIYLGYPWWGPSYYTYNYCPSYYSGWGWGIGWNWGWGGGWCGNGWGYGGYPGYGYYGYGYGGYGHGYGHGYNHGYQDGYWDGFWNGYYGGNYCGLNNNYYYNSHDNSGYYYGPHTNNAHANGNAITPHGKKFESAEFAGFVPVANSNSYQSVPRPNSNISNGVVNHEGSVPNTSTQGSLPTVGSGVVPKGNMNTGNTGPFSPNVNAVNMGSGPKVNTVDNSNLNHLPAPHPENPVAPANNTYQSPPRPVNPNAGGTPANPEVPKNFDTPKNMETPKNYQTPNNQGTPSGYDVPKNFDAPKNHEVPKGYETPKNYGTPKSYDPPKVYSTPKSYDAPKNNNHSTPRSYDVPRPHNSGGGGGGYSTPRSSGGGGYSGGSHSSGSSRPSGGFRHR